jgi:hypothetical protein
MIQLERALFYGMRRKYVLPDSKSRVVCGVALGLRGLVIGAETIVQNPLVELSLLRR